MENKHDYMARKVPVDNQNRSGGVGGSDAAAVLGCSPWASPLSLYMEKSGLAAPFEATPEMELGKLMEPAILNLWAKRTGGVLKHRETRILHPDHSEIWGTVDGIGERDGRVILLEAKFTNQFAGPDWDPHPPLHYLAQVQHNMMCLGLEEAEFAVLFGNTHYETFHVKRNDQFCTDLLDLELRFMESVRQMVAPDPDASEATKRALQRMYPRENDSLTTMQLPQEAEDWDRLYRNAKARLKTLGKIENNLKAVVTECENHVMAAMKEHGIALLPSGDAQYQWVTEHRSGYEVKPSSRRVLRRKRA